jgi:hypothetical protein
VVEVVVVVEEGVVVFDAESGDDDVVGAADGDALLTEAR